MDRKPWHASDKFVATIAVGIVAAAALAAALMTSRLDATDAAVAAAGQVSASANQKEVVTAPPLKMPPLTAQAPITPSTPSTRTPANSMGAAPVCRNCGVVQMVVAVHAYGTPRAEAYQMHIRMDDGTSRTVQQRGALAAGSRVLVEGDTVRVLAERRRPG
jgi:hypothetical protein